MRPGMSDGRGFTSYHMSCVENAAIMHHYGLKNQAEYRRFLQQHADEILDHQRSALAQDEDFQLSAGLVKPLYKY